LLSTAFIPYQAVEKRDLLRCASSFVIAAYWLYASFLRVRAPCISSFLNSLSEMLFFRAVMAVDRTDSHRGSILQMQAETPRCSCLEPNHRVF